MTLTLRSWERLELRPRNMIWNINTDEDIWTVLFVELGTVRLFLFWLTVAMSCLMISMIRVKTASRDDTLSPPSLSHRPQSSSVTTIVEERTKVLQLVGNSKSTFPILNISYSQHFVLSTFRILNNYFHRKRRIFLLGLNLLVRILSHYNLSKNYFLKSRSDFLLYPCGHWFSAPWCKFL